MGSWFLHGDDGAGVALFDLQTGAALIGHCALLDFQHGSSRDYDLTALLADAADSKSKRFAQVNRRILTVAKLDLRRGQKGANAAQVHVESALVDAGDEALDRGALTVRLADLIREADSFLDATADEEAAIFANGADDVAFQLVAGLNGQLAIFAAQLVERDHRLGLAANVEEGVLGADLDDLALDQLADFRIALGNGALLGAERGLKKLGEGLIAGNGGSTACGFHAEVTVLGLGLGEKVPGTAERRLAHGKRGSFVAESESSHSRFALGQFGFVLVLLL